MKANAGGTPRETAAPKRGRRVLASALALVLGLTLAPSTAVWAAPGDGRGSSAPDTATEQPEPSAAEKQPGSAEEAPVQVETAQTGDDCTTEAGAAGTVSESGGCEPKNEGALPNANSESVPGLALAVKIDSDGTPGTIDGGTGWDPNSNPGNDAGPKNGIVRVNDTVTYSVEYVVSSTEAENLTWSVTFPKGMQVMALPGFCMENGSPRAGSSLTPLDPSTNVTLPLTANSRDQLEQQTLTCNMGTKAVAADTVKVSAKVLNLVHQAQELKIVKADVTATGINVPEPASEPLPTVKASARLMWDISKNGLALEENTSGTVFGPAAAGCPWQVSEACIRTSYMVVLSAPAGGKGAMPAIGDVTFVDDFSPAAMYPQLSPAQIAQIEAEPNKYGSLVTAGQTQNGWQYPWSEIGQNGSATATNSVRDSGDISITQTNRGASATIRVSNADWSLRTVPSSTTAGSALPANTAAAASFVLHVYTPTAVIRDFGIQSAHSWTLPTMNKYMHLSIDGFTQNDHQDSADQPGPASATHDGTHWNDWRLTQPKLELPGGFRKDFVGAPGEPGNTPAAEFRPTYPIHDGPAGSPGGWQTGGITVAPTQNVVSQLWIGGSNSSLPADVSVVACDAWDNNELHLRSADYPAITAPTQTIASQGEAVWISAYNNVRRLTSGQSRMATNAGEAPELRVEYAAAAGGTGGASTCGDDVDGDPTNQDWYPSPDSVPGNDAALAAEGVYTAVSRVRVHLVLPEPVAPSTPINAGIVTAWVSIGLQVADAGQPTGTILPNWASQKRVNFADSTLEEVISHAGSWTPSSYNPENHTGKYGDRLIIAQAQARITKAVRSGMNGEFSATPPQVTGGDTVQYRLSPSLTSGAMTPGILKDVWVEDCLPASQTYSEASSAPALVSAMFPSDAKRAACAPGETYIRWILQQQEVNKPIEPIVVTVEVSPTADDGQYTNTVVVWAQDDATSEAQRKAQAGIQISNIAGVKLEKVALTPVVQVNRAGQTVANELNKWQIRLTNTLPASEQSAVSHPDMIDVLPKQGENGTAHNGTFKFVSAQVTQGGADTKVLYTKAANVSANPADPSNGASGATTWCDAPVGGTRVSGLNGCPASAAEVTALRVVRPVAYLSGDVIEVELSMVGVDNRSADRYVNRVMAQAQGLQYQVGPLNRPEVAVESKLGDYVWWDLNRNGVQDQWKGADEPLAEGVTVKLSGTDDLGNPVTAETKTNDEGKYVFEQLRSSDDKGYTVTFVKPAGSEFTAPLAGGDSGDKSLDSNAAVDTGASAPTVLGANARDYTIDAGLLPLGGVQISKLIEGVGASQFAADDELEFEVVCTFDDELGHEPNPVEVLKQSVTLPVNGAAQVLSEVLGGLPAFSSCTITEIDSGSADEAAAPVTVTIPWDGVKQRAGTPVASLTNFYSMGSVQVTKKLEGDRAAVGKAKDLVFEVLVTCQVEVPDPEKEGETKRADVYSGVVKVKGGQTKYLVDANDEPRGLPIGAKCFGSEVNTGGAAKAVVDLNTWEKSAEVVKGKPGDLQLLTITATNTFKDEPCTGLCMPNTGGQITGALLIGAGLLLAGALFLIKRRRKAEDSAHSVIG